jgi:methyl-accepting chemotaxis protein
LIDTYFRERVLDTETLGQVPSLQAFLAARPGPGYQDLATHALYALGAGIFRDKNYTVWTIFDPRGKLLLSYPTAPQPHGSYLVPPEDMQQVRTHTSFISSVYFTPATNKASVDIYSPIITPAPQQFLGFMRATLNLDYIWSIVRKDLRSNGDGSYAFILDHDGIRIADNNPARLFQAVAQPSPATQQLMSQEERYGTSDKVSLLADSVISGQNHDTPVSTSFQAQPAGEHGTFQVVRYASSLVPWNYFVLSPLRTVTAVADRQLLFTGLIALMVSILFTLVGLILGRRITYPILRAVEHLRNSSQSLTTLAVKQQDAASEQMWVVDSSQVGLQSVQYYTDATRVAASRLSQTGRELVHNWHNMNAHVAIQRLEQMIVAAQYIENATTYQSESNQNLATALKVATQVSEQLAQGATSATDAAGQLEQVVKNLRDVVGK